MGYNYIDSYNKFKIDPGKISKHRKTTKISKALQQFKV